MVQRKSKPDVTDADRALFRAGLDGVRPLSKDGKRRARDRGLPSARPQHSEADELAVIASLLDDDPEDADADEELQYARPGLQLAVMRRLKRGHYRCQAELDLHGLFVVVARPAVAQFLADSRDAGHRCVRIITGKGLRSGNRGPVLRNKVAGWLRRRDDVLAFSSARRVDGGTGAFYVLLRR